MSQKVLMFKAEPSLQQARSKHKGREWGRRGGM